MPEHPPLDLPETPRLAGNIAHFAASLRRAGLPAGPDRLILATRAVEAAGFTDRTDFYHTLQSVFVQRPEHRATFAQLFRLYWRDPRYLEHMMGLLTPTIHGVQEARAPKPAEKRAAEALLDRQADDPVRQEQAPPEEVAIDATATASGTERLRNLDFEQMSTAEMVEARRMLATLELPVRPLPSRRSHSAPHGRIDRRATLR
ncbi:MAG: VWA domain-containing protein, partial [Jannaschia sp.]